jgi:tetratricopeptide (TPR) repeat protein
MLARWIDEHPDDARARLLMANLVAGRGATTEAAEILRAVPDADPAWPAARMLLADFAQRSFDAPTTEALCRQVIARVPTAADPRSRLIYLYSLQQRPAEAREQLWQLYKASSNPRILVDLCLEASKEEIDIRGISPEVEQFLRRTPDDPFLRRAWGLSLLWSGRPAEALPHLEAAADRIVDDPLGRFSLAECRLQLGLPVAVPGDLGAEPAGSPADASRWWLFKARLEEAQGRKAEALASLRRAVELAPGSYEARFRLADALARAGDPDAPRQRAEADTLRDRADALRKTFTLLRSNGFRPDAPMFLDLAARCLASGLVPEARSWADEALEIDPGAQDARDLLASLEGKPDTSPIALSRPRLGRPAPAPVAAAPSAPPTSAPILVTFEDVAGPAGLAYTYDHGPRADLHLADTMGGGVALIDHDKDGLIDVYFINSCAFPYNKAEPPRPNKLFRNLGGMRFEDVTDRAGVGGAGYGMGAVVGDYDNDGDDDLFVTGLDRAILYRNHGDGTFADATAEAGVASDLWTTAAGFGDLDGDGDLDLYVATYVEGGGEVRPCLDHAGKPIHCSPGLYKAQPDLLFRNNGDGTFTDVSHESGIAAAPNGRGLGLAVADLDGDGRLDLYVANDASADFHFRNLGGLRFEEIGVESGLAYDGAGKATASMGVVADDLNDDGLIDLFHTNFLNEPSTLALNLGSGLFADGTLAAGLAAPSLSKVGFGAAAIDADLDGLPDLFTLNGHVDDQPWVNSPMAQLPQFFRAGPAGHFRLAPEADFPYLSRPRVGRGLARGDLDNDGLVDLVAVHRGSPAALLRNTTPPSGHWVGFALTGPDGKGTPVGAQVSVETGGQTRHRWLTSGTGYLSAHDQRLHFGLGAAATIDRVEIRWPDGSTRSWRGLPADRLHTLSPAAPTGPTELGIQ